MTTASAIVATPRLTEIAMKIHTGMLESLGINMYTSIGKSLVEFVANGFDAEAHEVKVTIPFDEIEAARQELKARVKKEYEEGKREDFKKIYEPLPDNIEIIIEDILCVALQTQQYAA